MNPISYFLTSPKLFWGTAFVLSIYYGYRGYLYQKHLMKYPQLNTTHTRLFVQYIQDFLYNFVSSIAGFVAFLVDYKIFKSMDDWSELSTGASFLISFIAIVAIIGMSGALPRIIWRRGLDDATKKLVST